MMALFISTPVAAWDKDGAIKQEKAASAQNMAGSMCANVCACAGLYSMCGYAYVCGNDQE